MKKKNLFVLPLVLLMSMIMGCAAPDAVITDDTGDAVEDSQPADSPDTEAEVTTDPEPVELILALNGTEESSAGWLAVVDLANQELADDNITIRVQLTATSSWTDYYAKITSQMAADLSPDLGLIPEAWFPILTENEQVIDLSSYIDAEINMDELYAEVFDNTAYIDGKYYGIPATVYFLVMYYNRDMFDAADLAYPSADWDNASSFDEIQTKAASFVSGEGIDKTYGFFHGPYMSYIGAYSVSNGGTNVFDDTGNCSLTSAESQEVYKWFDTMIHVDGSMPDAVPGSSVPVVISPTDLFLNGKMAMVVDGTWMMYAMMGVEDINLGVAALPAGATGEGISTHFIDDWVIWSGTEHPEEAQKALSALLSDAAFAEMATTGVAGMPIHRQYADEFVNNLLSTVFSPEDLATFVAAMDHASSTPYNSYYQEVDQLANNTMDTWLLGEMTYEEYATTLCGHFKTAASK